MMRVGPYDDDATSNRLFTRQLVAILKSHPELREEMGDSSVDLHQITARMREVRGLPLQDRIVIYLSNRLKDQLNWYGSKAAANRASAKHWFWASLGAQLAALIAAVLSIVDHPRIDIVAVLATTSAAFSAWSNLKRHDDLSKSYSVASQELLVFTDLVEEVDSEAEFAEIVELTESAISREHTMWIAKRSHLPMSGEPASMPSPAATHG
jgi:hypothetical protein